MKFIALILICSTSWILAGVEGPELFVAKKCVKCHTVESHQIKTTSTKDPSKITDLSKVGSELDKESLVAYIKKESMRNDKKHKLKFKGEETELNTLVDWALTLTE